MHEYVNKIICILNYDKTEHQVIQAFIWYQVYKSRIFSSLDISNCKSTSPLIFYDFSLISNAVLSTLAHID